MACDEECQKGMQIKYAQMRCDNLGADFDWYKDIKLEDCKQKSETDRTCQSITEIVMSTRRKIEHSKKRCSTMKYLKKFKIDLDEDETDLPEEDLEDSEEKDDEEKCDLKILSMKPDCSDDKYCMYGFCNSDNQCKPSQDEGAENDLRSSYMIEPVWCKDEKECDVDIKL